MREMFSYCSSLKNLKFPILAFNTADSNYMFLGSSKKISKDLQIKICLKDLIIILSFIVIILIVSFIIYILFK
jgi:hypothetical protein